MALDDEGRSYRYETFAADAIDFGALFTDRHEHDARQGFGEYDDIFGDELSVPIIYEP
jgi:hypothetical protein